MTATLAPVIPTPGELAAIAGIFLEQMSAAQVRDLGMVAPVFASLADATDASVAAILEAAP